MRKSMIGTACVLLAVVLAGCAGSSNELKRGSLHHVGLVWLEEPGREADRRLLIDAAHSFLREIPEVQSLSVGAALPLESPLVDSSFDVCFVMEFADRAALERYARHPVHEKAAREVFLPLASRIVFYDFVSESP